MNTVTVRQKNGAAKTKANGKWIAKAFERGEEKALATGQVVFDMAQDKAQEILDEGSRLAKKAGSKAVTYGKAHPIHTAVGGVIFGLLLGARLFSRRSE